jgi:DNA-directed RNA polymerase subunit RPC12/RpoP
MGLDLRPYACARCGGATYLEEPDELVPKPDRVCINCGNRVSATKPIDMSLEENGARRVARPPKGKADVW